MLENYKIQFFLFGLTRKFIFSVHVRLFLVFSLNTRISTGFDQGELLLGGYDTTKFVDPITYVSVNQKGYWRFTVDNISTTIGSSTTIIASSFNAVFDTGATYAIVGPTAYINQIFTTLDAKYDPTTRWVRQK